MKRSYYLVLAIVAVIILAQCKPSAQKESTDTVESQAEMEERYIALGNAIVDTTFKTLGGQLKGAVKEGGVEHAVEYCKLNAYPIVEELSVANDAEIYRRSKKYRNPDNDADSMDVFVYQLYEQAMEGGTEFGPLLIDNPTENTITYFKPIMMQEFCLVCHGSKETIGPAYETIASLYPNDLAIDFEAGDLRGLWRVDFGKN